MNAAPRQETLVGTRTRNLIWFVLSAILLCHARGYAQSGPQPPCGSAAVSVYPGLDDLAVVKSWSKSEGICLASGHFPSNFLRSAKALLEGNRRVVPHFLGPGVRRRRVCGWLGPGASHAGVDPRHWCG